MKILVVHSELGVLRGGGENFTRNLFQAVVERGHEVSAVFVADRNGHYPIMLPPRITAFPLPGRWSRKFGQEALSTVGRKLPQGSNVRAQWDRIQEAICWRTVRWHEQRFMYRIEREFAARWQEYDAVYVHGSAVLASRIAHHRPTVVRLPGPVPAECAPRLKAVQAVCANGDALDQVRKFLGDHAVELPVGLEIDVFTPGLSQVRERLGWTNNHWVVGYVGRLAYIKGIDLLAEAFHKVRQSIPQARLLIVGLGEEEQKVRAILNAEIVKGIVHMEPDVPHDHLADWYRAMNLFVMPSRYENFSNAVLEALACGVPFLVSDVGGSRHLVAIKGGWFCAPNSTDSLAEGLVSASEDRLLAKNLGALGGQEVREKYSWSATAKRLEEILKSCLHEKAGSTCRP